MNCQIIDKMKSSSSIIQDSKANNLNTVIIKTPKRIRWLQFGNIIYNIPNNILWNVIIMLTSLLNYIFVTIDLTFPQKTYDKFLCFYLMFDIIYTVNLFISIIHITFWWESPNYPIKSSFSLLTVIIDSLTLVPQLLILLLIIDPSLNTFIPLIRISTVLRLRYLSIYRKILKTLPMKRWRWVVAQYCTIFILFIHNVNCLWFFIEWNNELNKKSFNIIENPTEWYFLHVYYTIQLMLNIGLGDVYPKTWNEINLFIIILISGQIMIFWLTTSLSLLLIFNNNHLINTKIKIQEVIEYIKDANTSTKIKIKSYYNKKHLNNVQLLLETIPFSLKQDVLYDINCGLLHRSVLLRVLPTPILKKVSLVMKRVFFPAGELIYTQYLIKTRMVCVEDGVVEVLNDEDQESPIMCLKKGTVLGETALFFNIPSKVSVRARSDADLYVLEKRDFLEIMRCFPEEYKKLQQLLDKRIKSSNQISKLYQKNSVPSLRRLKVRLSSFLVKSDEFDKEEEFYSYKLYDINKEEEKVDENELYKKWRAYNDLFQITFCIIYPYYVMYKKYVPDYVFYIGIIIDICCFFDAIYQIKTPIKIKEKWIRSNLQIFDYRLNDLGFNLDIISLFPLEIWSFLFENTTLQNRYYDLFKLNRLLRLHKLPRLLLLLNNGNKGFLCTESTKTFIYLLIFIYYSSCFLYLIACFEVICDDSSWFYLSSARLYSTLNTSSTALLESLYFTITSIVATGIGDILPRSSTDYWIVTLLIITFFVIKCYCVGNLTSSIFLNVTNDGTVDTNEYIKHLSNHSRLPKSFKKTVHNFLQINPNFYVENSVQFIKESLPNTIESLLQHSKLNKICKKLPLFKRTDPQFFECIEMNLKQCIIPKQEILYTYGTPTRRMFIIIKGYCDLYNAENTLEKTVGPHSQLGFLEMIYCLPKRYTVVTKTDCLLFYLDYNVLDYILKLFPKELDTLESVMFQKDLLEAVARLEMIEDTFEIAEIKDVNDVNAYRKQQFVCFTKTWSSYWRIYEEKLGVLYGLGSFLLPISVHPESAFLKFCCFTRIFLILTQFFTSILMTFLPLYAENLNWIIWLCQGSLCMEMYLNFHVGYYGEDGVLHLHPADTAWHYLNHSFLVDFISMFPWDYFNDNPLQPLLNINTKIQCQSLWTLFLNARFIQLYKVFKCIKYFGDVNFNFVWRVFQLFLCITFLSHILVGISAGCLKQYQINNTEYLNANKSSDVDTNYFYIFYIIIDWLTNTGINKLTSADSYTKCIAILTTLAGLSSFALLTSTISTINLVDDNESFRIKVITFIKNLNKNKIDYDLKQSIIGHFENIWDKTKGFDVNSKIYHKKYFKDTLLTQHYEGVLQSVPLLNHFDTNYMPLILNHTNINYFQKGEVIVNYKDVLFDIFIICAGQVEVFDKNKDPLCLLNPGACFGNLQKNIHGLSKVNVTARKNLELMVLNTQLFFNTIKYYPLIVQELDTLLKTNPAYLTPVYSNIFYEFGDAKSLFDEINIDEEQVAKMDRSCNRFNFALKPDHVTYTVLDTLTFIASLLNIIFIPYIFVTQDAHYFGYIYLCFEPVFYARIYFELHKSYTNVFGDLIVNNKKLGRRYFNSPGGLFWDTFPNFPITLVCYCFGAKERFFSYTCFRLFHMLRFYYIVEFFQKDTKHLHRKMWLYHLKLVTYFIILIHLCSCLWFMTVCPFNNCLEETGMSKLCKNFHEKSTINKMHLSYYYVLNVITTTGIGDLTPHTHAEIILTVIFMLLGKIYFAIFMGTILKKMYISQKNHLDYEAQIKTLTNYLQHLDVSDFILKRTSTYLKKLWIHDNDVNNHKEMLVTLSYPLQQKLMMNLYGNVLKETFMFRDLDQNLLSQICTKIKRTLYFKDDYVVKAGDVSQTMFFIESGSVAVLTKHVQLTETQHIILEEKEFFGVCQGLGIEGCHKFCYRVSSLMVEILSLSYEDWSYLLDFFPRDKQQVLTRVHKECHFLSY